MDVFKIIGAVGLIFIIYGMLVKREAKRDFIYLLGGILLLIYSIYIKDWIFIILQSVFIIIAAYEEIKLRAWKDTTHKK